MNSNKLTIMSKPMKKECYYRHTLQIITDYANYEIKLQTKVTGGSCTLSL